MAIRVNLDHVLLDRRLTLTDLAERIGITIANLSVLKTNKARAIRFSAASSSVNRAIYSNGLRKKRTKDLLRGDAPARALTRSRERYRTRG